ncbi:MAG: flavodoxin family protein [Chloroflexota bacterium]
MYEVIYFSQAGKTKRVAEAIAQELGAVAENVKTKKEPSKDAFLFLGSGCYGGKPGKALLEFIQRNDFSGREVALFGTSGGPEGTEITVMEEALTGKGAQITGKFWCQGKFLFMNRKHPDAADLENARKFAREMKKG